VGISSGTVGIKTLKPVGIQLISIGIVPTINFSIYNNFFWWVGCNFKLFRSQITNITRSTGVPVEAV
jgi:hypothetical protein